MVGSGRIGDLDFADVSCRVCLMYKMYKLMYEFTNPKNSCYQDSSDVTTVCRQHKDIQRSMFVG